MRIPKYLANAIECPDTVKAVVPHGKWEEETGFLATRCKEAYTNFDAMYVDERPYVRAIAMRAQNIAFYQQPGNKPIIVFSGVQKMPLPIVPHERFTHIGSLIRADEPIDVDEGDVRLYRYVAPQAFLDTLRESGVDHQRIPMQAFNAQGFEMGNAWLSDEEVTEIREAMSAVIYPHEDIVNGSNPIHTYTIRPMDLVQTQTLFDNALELQTAGCAVHLNAFTIRAQDLTASRDEDQHKFIEHVRSVITIPNCKIIPDRRATREWVAPAQSRMAGGRAHGEKRKFLLIKSMVARTPIFFKAVADKFGGRLENISAGYQEGKMSFDFDVSDEELNKCCLATQGGAFIVHLRDDTI